MPIVPSTKIWIRNKELDQAIEQMEEANPMERIAIANQLAVSTIKRQRQAKSNFTKVYSFIIHAWFKEGHLFAR